MIVKTKSTTVTVLFFLIFCAVNLSAVEAAKKSGKTKILVGSGLMAGGVALALTADVFDKGDDLQFLGGIGVFGAGVVVTVLGILEHSRRNLESTSLKEQVEPRLEMQLIAGPTRKGISAGMMLKW